MTVARAHELHMIAVREGRASRAKRKNKPRTISDKLEIYQSDIAPRLGKKSIYAVVAFSKRFASPRPAAEVVSEE